MSAVVLEMTDEFIPFEEVSPRDPRMNNWRVCVSHSLATKRAGSARSLNNQTRAFQDNRAASASRSSKAYLPFHYTNMLADVHYRVKI